MLDNSLILPDNNISVCTTFMQQKLLLDKWPPAGVKLLQKNKIVYPKYPDEEIFTSVFKHCRHALSQLCYVPTFCWLLSWKPSALYRWYLHPPLQMQIHLRKPGAMTGKCSHSLHYPPTVRTTQTSVLWQIFFFVCTQEKPRGAEGLR